MNLTTVPETKKQQDRYLSRSILKAQMVKRIDPVISASKTIPLPIDSCLSQLTNEGGAVAATGKSGSVLVADPFCDQPPRLEYICTGENIAPVIFEAQRG